MQEYQDLTRSSGILRYESGPDYITVEFKEGAQRFYRYTFRMPGVTHVEHMKRLAEAGSGLNTYIKKVIGKNFESKW